MKNPLAEKTVKRHINNRPSNPGHFTPFNAMHYFAERCQRFQFEHPLTCMGSWDDGIRQDCLGPIVVDTGLQND